MKVLYGLVAAGLICGAVSKGGAKSFPVEAALVDVTTRTVTRGTTDSAEIETYRQTGIAADDQTTAAVRGPAVEFDPATMMRTEDIRPGMTGYGMTVFSGLEPERFEAEVIGVRHGMMAGTDIILVRLKSEHLVNLGVIAGMSGSPIYVDDKLIGAVAYGFLDVDDPLAGVTPMEDMLAVYNSTPTEPALGPADGMEGDGLKAFEGYMALKAEPSLANLAKVAVGGSRGRGLQMHGVEFGSDAVERFGIPESFTLEPLSAPVLVSGQSAVTARLASTVFPNLNMVNAGQEMAAMSAGVPSTHALTSPGGPVEDLDAFADSIVGGHALAVPFVEGDLNMAGVGTVTWREGNRLIAFGHPMFQNGSVYFPMAAARINALIRSRTRPFKLGEPVGHIGMVRQDRLPAIGGLFGQTAKMFPVTVTVADPEYTGKREFNFRVWNDRQMTPGLVLSAIADSVGTGARWGGDSAAIYSYSIALDDGTSVSAENYTSDSDGSIMAVLDVMSDTGMLLNNPYKRVGLESLDFEIRVADRLRRASIEAATLDKGVYRPGETATVEWVVRPYRAETFRMSYSFVVPDMLPDGEYDVQVSDASRRQAAERRRNPGGANLNSFDDVVRVIQENYAQNRVYVSLVDKDTGVSVEGSEMPRLPGSVIGLIQDTVSSAYVNPVRGNFVIDADIATAYEISGEASVKLKIERR